VDDNLSAPQKVPAENLITELVKRLAETETALEDAVDGQVDAVIIPESATPYLLHRAQQALRENEKSLRLLVEQLPALVWTTDSQLTITSCRGAYLAHAGLQPHALVGKTLGSDTCPGEVDAEIESYHRRTLEGVSQRYEITINDRHYQCHIEPLYDAQGDDIQGVIGVALDITERKQAEESLARRHHDLSVLNAITTAATSTLDLGETLSTLQELLASAENMPGGTLYLFEWGRPEPCEGIHWGISDETARSFREAAALYFQAFAAGHTAQRYQSGDGDMPGCILIPLMTEDNLLGVLCLLQDTDTDRAQYSFRETLARQIGIAIQNSRLYEQVRSGHERLQALSRRLVETQEAERRYIARELHDEVGQVLTGLNIILEIAKRLPTEAIRTSLDEAQERVYEIIDQVRRMSLDLRPPMLDDLGLLSALRWHFDRYTAQTEVEVHFDCDEGEPDIEGEAALAIYRIIQEALTNIARHARVRAAYVSLRTEGDRMRLQITDRGVGFDPHTVLAAGTSVGLAGMAERVALLGGDLAIETEPGNGTRLCVDFPLHRIQESTK
jgi:PAS domain S-box-containing protein